MKPGITASYAKAFAVAKHGKQKYGTMCYAYHLQNVVENIKSRNSWGKLYKTYDMILLKVCAYLHDVLEDTETTYEELSNVFGKDVADIVEKLTARDTETNQQYLDRIKECPYATMIKICDSLTNYNHSVMEMDRSRMDKYSYNIAYLTNVLNA